MESEKWVKHSVFSNKLSQSLVMILYHQHKCKISLKKSGLFKSMSVVVQFIVRQIFENFISS